ncbi:MAG: glycosyltransferase family 4 protein [Methylococcaceae bacterium]
MPSKPKILVISYEFPPLGGGGAKVVAGLIDELKKTGYRFDVVTMGFKGLPRVEKQDNVTIYRVPCIRLNQSMCYALEMIPYLIMALPILFKLVRKNNYAINHTHFIFPDAVLSYLVKLFTKLPFVVTAHGSDVPGYNPDRFKLIHKLLLPFWKFITNRADTIICPSETIETLIHKSNPDAKTKVIPNGIDVHKFDPNRQKEKKALAVTRLFERKGIQHFLNAHHQLQSTWEANIAGDGQYLQNIKDLVAEKKINANILGFLDNNGSELKELYETSSIFVFPSEAENFPICLLEAMVAGMAIITTKNTGCAEVVGDAALLVEPKSVEDVKHAYQKLMNDDALREKLGKMARERVENLFSWERVRKDTIELYDALGKNNT